MRTILFAIASALLAALCSTAAIAATTTKFTSYNPASACTLSIPTTDTGVRPKASGFRNEGTVNNFVICSFAAEGRSGELTPYLDGMFLTFIPDRDDNAAVSFNCTAMDRTYIKVTGDYSTKTVTIPAWAGGINTNLEFSPQDFPTSHLTGGTTSITCLLPPGVAVVGAVAYQNIGQ